MRIGIDFDNTIICYDEVFCHLAKAQQFVAADYHGSKRELRAIVQASAEGDVAWQRLQGKAYGEFLKLGVMFQGFSEFLIRCLAKEDVEVFIVSHKTEFGHFDEKRINLRDAARAWLRAQGFFDGTKPLIPEKNLYFESTREAKIKRIRALGCTHFIDDLEEVLHAPTFPADVRGYLFKPADYDAAISSVRPARISVRPEEARSAVSKDKGLHKPSFETGAARPPQDERAAINERGIRDITVYPTWMDINHAIFS